MNAAAASKLRGNAIAFPEQQKKLEKPALKNRLCWVMNFRRACFSLMIVALLPALLWGREAREQARIDFLIHGVETATDVKFIRNGSDYDGIAGAKHLRMKLNYAGERVKTAEDFVKYCASESSFTHQKYKIRSADGTMTDTATYFRAKLREFDEKH